MSHSRKLLALFLAITMAESAVVTRADDEDTKKDTSKGPAVKLMTPLAAVPGEKLTVRLRGVGLAEASEVRVTGPAADGGHVELKKKGKAEGGGAADDFVKKKLGDTQVEVELTVPPGASAGDGFALVVVTPQGETPPAPLRIVPDEQLVSESEPNGGLRQSQGITADHCTVRGTVGEDKDVDVYRLSGKAGQTLRAEVIAAAKGSALDAAITVYDAKGRALAADDDNSASAAPQDPLIELKLPADGDVFLVVTDVNDKGGAQTHPYLLNISKQ
jgi:hypothetical protein